MIAELQSKLEALVAVTQTMQGDHFVAARISVAEAIHRIEQEIEAERQRERIRAEEERRRIAREEADRLERERLARLVRPVWVTVRLKVEALNPAQACYLASQILDSNQRGSNTSKTLSPLLNYQFVDKEEA